MSTQLSRRSQSGQCSPCAMCEFAVKVKRAKSTFRNVVRLRAALLRRSWPARGSDGLDSSTSSTCCAGAERSASENAFLFVCQFSCSSSGYQSSRIVGLLERVGFCAHNKRPSVSTLLAVWQGSTLKVVGIQELRRSARPACWSIVHCGQFESATACVPSNAGLARMLTA